MWRPRFLISVISANGRISPVKPGDAGQTWVNLGHHLENRADNPYWTPWPSQPLVKDTVKPGLTIDVGECRPELLPRSPNFT
jgi:hypothetical protein